jgi:membrane protein DedA with SNARE-associated domain
MDIWAEFMQFLNQYSADPVAYGFIFFIYSVLATIILPLPVEIGLVLNPDTPFVFKALILGAGKAVGSILVFYIGFRVEGTVRRWSERWRFAKWFVDLCTRFVEKTGYFGLYVLLCIPGMVDTIPVYVFSLFNREGRVLEVRYFALVNFLGGITRAFILFALFYFGGIDLFGSLS